MNGRFRFFYNHNRRDGPLPDRRQDAERTGILPPRLMALAQPLRTCAESTALRDGKG